MAKKAVIKRKNFNTVDLQIVGSTAVLFDVPVSAQVSWDMVGEGRQALVDFVDERPVVLHTFDSNPNYYSPQPESYVTVIENALLSDGSVPLQGNLNVLPGITIDGYDISVLGQAISNLQAGDTIARTGWTVFTHSTYLVTTINSSATEIIVRDAMFDLHEQITMSNTNGEIEFMRINSAATQTLDANGGVCYIYTVVRRVATSPNGLVTGWAAASLVNGLTKRGYITIDNRHVNSHNSPNMTGVIWKDNPPTAQERVFRLGNLKGILGISTDDFGFAVGALDTKDCYMVFNGSSNSFLLRNAGIEISDSSEEKVVKLYGVNEGGRLAGDYDFGKVSAVHNSFYGEEATWGVYRGESPIIEIREDHSFLRDMFTIGNPDGARIDLGELNNTSMLALRDASGVAKLVAKTDDNNNVFVHIGNPPPENNSMWFDSATGKLNVNGHVTVQSMNVTGRAAFSSTGSFEISDPDDPNRRGMITPRGIYGYSVDGFGQQYLSSIDAWGPLTLETRPGSGVWKTWLAGEMMRGDPDHRSFRYQRGPSGKLGLFNGDVPLVYIDAQGRGVFGNDDGESVIVDTVDGIKFFGIDESNADPAGGRLITVWADENDDWPTHRISADLDINQSPQQHRLVLQTQPQPGSRASVLLSSIGDKQAHARVRAVGGYDTVNQQVTQIDLWAYRNEGALFNYSRIDLVANAIKIEPYRSSTAFSGTIGDGTLMYTDGTWNPGGLGEGLYLYSYGAWHLIRGPYLSSHRWGSAASYAQFDGYGTLTFVGDDARLRPRLGNETKSSNFTASTSTYYRINTTGGAVTVSLPTAVGISGVVYTFKLINGANTLTIDPYSMETIDGASNWSTTKLYEKITIISNGTNWEIIA